MQGLRQEAGCCDALARRGQTSPAITSASYTTLVRKIDAVAIITAAKQPVALELLFDYRLLLWLAWKKKFFPPSSFSVVVDATHGLITGTRIDYFSTRSVTLGFIQRHTVKQLVGLLRTQHR